MIRKFSLYGIIFIALNGCIQTTASFIGPAYTIASTGNATDFGDLTAALQGPMGTSNKTRAVYGGGDVGGSNRNQIDYITIASTGNGQDFGDLTVTGSGGRRNGAAAGDSHGGIS